MWYVGVDGCSTGWVYIALHGKKHKFGVVKTAVELLNAVQGDFRVFIDIPVGLLDGGDQGRQCDTGARAVLGPRRSSVFPAPYRPVLAATSYEQAQEISINVAGRSISKQAFAIVPKIREVDSLLRNNQDARSRIREVHPEVCFWSLAAQQPMGSHKKTEEGFEERMKVLESAFPGATAIVAEAYLWTSGKGVARDDVVDAMVGAVTASFPESQQRTLPTQPPMDPTGLPMEMVYAVPPP